MCCIICQPNTVFTADCICIQLVRQHIFIGINHRFIAFLACIFTESKAYIRCCLSRQICFIKSSSQLIITFCIFIIQHHRQINFLSANKLNCFIYFFSCLFFCNCLWKNIYANFYTLSFCTFDILDNIFICNNAACSPSSVTGTDNRKFYAICFCFCPIDIWLKAGNIHTIMNFISFIKSRVMNIATRYCTHCCNTILFLHFLPILWIICVLRVYFRFILRLIHSLCLRCLWCIWRRFCIGSLLCWYNRSTFCLNNCFCLRFCGILRTVSDIYHNSLLSAQIVRCSRICKSW